jgi:phage major head subunit gpT-like protein
MSVTKSVLPYEELYTGLQLIFKDTYDMVMKESFADQIATTVQSNAESENYAWLGDIPGVREWIGGRQFKDISSYSYNVINKLWEVSMSVKRSDLEDDKYGLIKTKLLSLASEAARHKEELAMTMLKNGLLTTAVANCYDGNAFFSDSHTAYDNKAAVVLSTDNLWAAVEVMTTQVSDTGKPLGVNPDTLVVCPKSERTAREILESPMYPDAMTQAAPFKNSVNTLQGKFKLIVSPYLITTSKKPWFLLDTSKPVKPIIFQERVPIEFMALEGNSETGFLRDEWLYGTRARYNAGYGLFQLAYGSAGA